jgi:hypothetical protein
MYIWEKYIEGDRMSISVCIAVGAEVVLDFRGLGCSGV